MGDGICGGRLDGKACIVTGAASGIGAAAVRLFAEHGAHVLAVDLDGEGLERLRASSDTVRCVKADLALPAAAEQIALEAVACFGRLDVLFSNAGVHGSGTTPDARWEHCLEVNLTAAHRLALASHPHIRDTGGGSVIFTASVSGPLVGFASAHYDASKAGLIGLTRHLASAWGRDDIRVNALCPGFIQTPFIGEYWTDERLRKVRGDTALGRLGKADEVAKAALFLASDDASYVTGTSLVVDGGWTVHYGKY